MLDHSQDDIILEVNHLSVKFSTDKSENIVVRDVSFDVKKGETLAIVGESGSGKSVTALSIMGLLPAISKISEGEIIFHSQLFGEVNLSQVTPSQLRQIRGKEIGMIFQEPMTSLNPVFTCG